MTTNSNQPGGFFSSDQETLNSSDNQTWTLQHFRRRGVHLVSSTLNGMERVLWHKVLCIYLETQCTVITQYSLILNILKDIFHGQSFLSGFKKLEVCCSVDVAVWMRTEFAEHKIYFSQTKDHIHTSSQQANHCRKQMGRCDCLFEKVRKVLGPNLLQHTDLSTVVQIESLPADSMEGAVEPGELWRRTELTLVFQHTILPFC